MMKPPSYSLAAIGFTSTIAQIVLMRELVATFYGNELLFGLALMSWLAWGAVGAWGLSGLAARPRWGWGTLAGGLALVGVIFPAQIIFVRETRALLGVMPGAFVEFGPMVGAIGLMLAPLCLLIGFLFVLGTRLTVEVGYPPGQAYVWESIGAVAGGALFSFLLIHWLDPFQTALLVTSANLVVAACLWLPFRLTRPLLFTALLSLLLLLFSLLLGRTLHQTTLGRQWPNLAFAADSPYGRLVIQARDSQRVFFENGLLAFETQGTFAEEVVHFPLLTHPHPDQVLLVGGGVAGNLREILKHPLINVTYVELDPLLIEAARQYLPPADVAPLDDPRVSLVLSDGRHYIKQSPTLFDVIILDLPEPATGALNRFYTQEFFTEARARLEPGGILALGLPSAENYWSPELTRRNSAIYRTLKAVFPEIVVIPGEHNFFLASASPLETEPAALAARLTGRSIQTRWVTPEYLSYIFTTDRFVGVQQALAAAAEVRINTDLAPVCYYYDLALWLSRFYPAAIEPLRYIFEGASLFKIGWLAAPLGGIVILTRWRRRWAVPVAVAGLGLAQMTLQLVLLLAFQVQHGYVYTQVSLLVTTFMAGLAAGGGLSNRLRQTKEALRKILLAVQVTIILYSVLLPFILSFSLPAVVFPLLALAAGLLTGMAFPLAVVLVGGPAGRAAGMLYGADLAGGCLGALAGAVFFIPVLGLTQTCVVVALVGLAGLLALG